MLAARLGLCLMNDSVYTLAWVAFAKSLSSSMAKFWLTCWSTAVPRLNSQVVQVCLHRCNCRARCRHCILQQPALCCQRYLQGHTDHHVISSLMCFAELANPPLLCPPFFFPSILCYLFSCSGTCSYICTRSLEDLGSQTDHGQSCDGGLAIIGYMCVCT